MLLLDLIRGDSTARPEVPRLFSGSSGTSPNHQTPSTNQISRTMEGRQHERALRARRSGGLA